MSYAIQAAIRSGLQSPRIGTRRCYRTRCCSVAMSRAVRCALFGALTGGVRSEPPEERRCLSKLEPAGARWRALAELCVQLWQDELVVATSGVAFSPDTELVRGVT
jgi:hypothetical protein